ncbi:helix-turn-helix transcriptional regulator [Novosphingobium sp. B 225]|uniref:helix-turn-helix transcriptional regulator n=1 Tax=Novosphingobium sp. B 225 TaxID=1961849 RepID=UPI000B4AE1C3|nr:helix-turn-helix transcriptional regulator [Novosphingobium sp. B 225]
MATRLSDHEPLPQLTTKQREVMALVADNRTSKEIAGLLGISESAVNQRIEMIRTRLGGIPRGELARLYRQEFARNRQISGTFPPNWQKIQVPENAETGQTESAESIPAVAVFGSQTETSQGGDGSQLSSPSYVPGGPVWLTRDHPLMGFLRAAAIAVIVIAGMVIAAQVTHMIS